MAREPEPIVERRRALGIQLATFRQAAELTQGQLGKTVHRDRTTVVYIEKGQSRGDEQLLNPDETDRLTQVSNNPRQIDRAALRSLATVLHESRRLEDTMGAAPLLPAARAQLALFEHLVAEARGPLRRRVVLLGSQYAQFAAWLHSSAAQPNKARLITTERQNGVSKPMTQIWWLPCCP